MAKRCSKPPNMKLGGDIPEMSMGGSIATGAASGAGLGFSIGGPWGAAAGAVAGGAMGFFKEKKTIQAEDEAMRSKEHQAAQNQLFLDRQADQQILREFPTYGVNESYAEKGGKVNPQYEAEDKEVVQFNQSNRPQVIKGGKLKPLSSITATIQGNSHEEGGIDMIGGDRIFSDELEIDEELLMKLTA